MLRQSVRGNFYSNPDLMRLQTADSPNENSVPTNLKKIYELVIQYSTLGRYELAIPLCKQGIDEFRKVYGNEHVHVATLLNVLATIYRCQHRYKEAAMLLNDALIIREKHFGKEHPIVTNTINKLAYLYSKQNKLKEAEEFSIRGIEVRGKALEINNSSKRAADSANSKRSEVVREKYFNLIVSKPNQISKSKTTLSASNKYLCNNCKIKSK